MTAHLKTPTHALPPHRPPLQFDQPGARPDGAPEAEPPHVFSMGGTSGAAQDAPRE